MNNVAIELLGGLLIWIFKGFKGTLSKWRDHKYAFLVGIGFIFLIVIILSMLWLSRKLTFVKILIHNWLQVRLTQIYL